MSIFKKFLGKKKAKMPPNGMFIAKLNALDITDRTEVMEAEKKPLEMFLKKAMNLVYQLLTKS